MSDFRRLELNQAPLPAPEERPAANLREILGVLWASRLRLVLAVVLAAALGYGTAMMLPRWYRAQVSILPPDEADFLMNMSLAGRALSKFPALGVLGDYFTPADIYKATLKSRTAREHVVDRFGLQDVYRQKSREKTLQILGKRTTVKLSPDGTIALTVDDRDPARAAAMAAAYIEALDRYNIRKRNTQAGTARRFLERRVAETDSALRRSEVVLKEYLETHRTVVPNAATSGDAQAAADIMGRKLMLEVRLGVLRSYLQDDHEQVVQTRGELEALNRSIAALPALQSGVARLVRDYKVQEQLFLLLTTELEQARIREAQDTPTVHVLDRPAPPERPVWPRRTLTALAAAALAFLGMAIWEYTRSRRELHPAA